jgi:hypothetical protein
MGQAHYTLQINNSKSPAMKDYVKIAQKHQQKVFGSKKKNKK